MPVSFGDVGWLPLWAAGAASGSARWRQRLPTFSTRTGNIRERHPTQRRCTATCCTSWRLTSTGSSGSPGECAGTSGTGASSRASWACWNRKRRRISAINYIEWLVFSCKLKCDTVKWWRWRIVNWHAFEKQMHKHTCGETKWNIMKIDALNSIN